MGPRAGCGQHEVAALGRLLASAVSAFSGGVRVVRRVGHALGLLWLAVCLLFTEPAYAETEAVQVVVHWNVPPGPVLDEALVRIQGELGAVGIDVSVRYGVSDGSQRLGAGIYGVLEVRGSGLLVEVRATTPGLDAPVVQMADLSRPEVTAEVVAVRAVEALRAALLEWTRQRGAGAAPLPEAVRRFGRITADEPSAVPPQGTPARSRPRAEQSTVAPPRSVEEPATRFGVGVRLGSSLVWELPARITTLPVGGGLWGSWRQFGLELLATRTLVHAEQREPEGVLLTKRSTLALRASMNFAAAPGVRPFVAVGFGAAYYQTDAQAERAFVGHEREHLTACVIAHTGAALWWADWGGMYGSLDLELALDAPRLQVLGRNVGTYSSPALGLSLGVLFGTQPDASAPDSS